MGGPLWKKEENPVQLRPNWPGAIVNDRGNPRPCEHNAKILLEDRERFDELHYDRFLDRLRLGDRDWSDHDDRATLCWLQEFTGVAFTLAHVRNAIDVIGQSRARDSLQEFIDALPEWDSEPRIETAFIEAWGAQDDELTRAASRNFFLALLARALRPGAQVDTLWVFEGPQGSYKSRSLRALCGSFHAEITAQIGTTDFMRELRGLWVAELSELDSLRGREASTVKRLLSAPSDRFVEKFEKHAASYPRRAVAVATTNEATYWQDHTGARRLIPVRVGAINVELIEKERVQWFAEARERVSEGATWWEFPAAITSVQDSRQQTDPWEDLLSGYIEKGRPIRTASGDAIETWPEGWIASAEIMGKWLDLEPHQQGPTSGLRLSKVMKRLGYRPERHGRRGTRGWMPDIPAPAEQGMSASMSADDSPSEIPF